MNNKTVNHFSSFFVLLLLIFTGGCMKQGLPIYYYTLDGSTQPAVSRADSVPDILVGPIHIASFLDQGQLVTQNSAYSVNLEEQHRWAGDLQEMVSNVLINDLSHALGTDKIYSFPSTQAIEGLQLTISLLHLEKNPDGQALVEARWEIISDDGQTILHISTSSYKTASETSDYDALVKGLSEGLSRLSKEIADKISQLTSMKRKQA
ncbi:MAG: PqiC family protein [Thermodesulfobacteriota bacterium]|nr:PqiC family protein [Thermodesulfobacteriota bacterium]